MNECKGDSPSATILKIKKSSLRMFFYRFLYLFFIHLLFMVQFPKKIVNQFHHHFKGLSTMSQDHAFQTFIIIIIWNNVPQVFWHFNTDKLNIFHNHLFLYADMTQQFFSSGMISTWVHINNPCNTFRGPELFAILDVFHRLTTIGGRWRLFTWIFYFIWPTSGWVVDNPRQLQSSFSLILTFLSAHNFL